MNDLEKNETKKYALERLNTYIIYDGTLKNIDKENFDEKDFIVFNKLNYYDLDDKKITILRKMLRFQVNQQEVLKYTKKKIKECFNSEDIVKEYIKFYDDILKIRNMIGKRIRDLSEIIAPEYSKEKLEEIIDKIIKIINQEESSEMGIEFDKIDAKIKNEIIETIKKEIEHYKNTEKLMEHLKESIEGVLKYLAPNFTYLATPIIAARLLNTAGTLKELALMPASTIQVLGAEKAMFLYLSNKTKSPPKYGFIYSHPLVSRAKNKGKVARKLANKLSLCLKKDIFGDKEFIADQFLQEIEKSISE